MNQDSQTVAALFQAVTANPDLVRQHALTSSVTSLASATNGVTVAGTADGKVVRWHPDTEGSDEIQLGDSPVTAVGVSDDGTTVAASDGRRAVAWRAGAAPRPLGKDQPGPVAVSSTGSTVVVLTSPEAGVQSVTTYTSDGTQQGEVDLGPHYWEAVGMPDEQTIALSGVNGGVWQRLQAADLTVTVQQGEQMSPHSRGISATSEDGFFTGFLAGWATIFDTSNARAEGGVARAGGGQTPDMFAIRQDGRKVASAGGGRLWVADVTDGTGEPGTTRELTGAGGAQHVAFVGSSDRLISANGPVLSVWAPGQPSRLRLDKGTLVVPDTPAVSAPTKVAVSPDGQRALLVGGFGDVVLHAFDEREPTGTAVTGPESDILPAWLPDGTPILIGRATCSIYAIRGSTVEQRFPGAGGGAFAAHITSAGQHVTCVDVNGGVTVRQVSDGVVIDSVPGETTSLTESAGAIEVGLVAISDDGNLIARIAGQDSGDGTLTVLDRTTRQTVVVPGAAQTVDFAGNRLLVTRADGALQVWNARGDQLLKTITSSSGFARPLSWVPGTTLVARVRNDGAIVLTDIEAGTTLGALPLPELKAVLATAPWEATGITGAAATGELITANPNGTVARWAATERTWISRACQFAGRDLRQDEWSDITGATSPDDLRCRRHQ